MEPRFCEVCGGALVYRPGSGPCVCDELADGDEDQEDEEDDDG